MPPKITNARRAGWSHQVSCAFPSAFEGEICRTEPNGRDGRLEGLLLLALQLLGRFAAPGLLVLDEFRVRAALLGSLGLAVKRGIMLAFNNILGNWGRIDSAWRQKAKLCASTVEAYATRCKRM